MSENATSTIVPTPLPNPVIGHMQSPIERAYANATQPLQSAMPANGASENLATGLEAARAADRGERAQLSPRDNTPNNRSEQDRISYEQSQNQLKMRPREKRVAADWDTVNKDRDNLRRELETLRAASVKSGGTGALAPDGFVKPVSGAAAPLTLTEADVKNHPAFKALKEKHDSYYEEIKHVRVEADPEFRAKFDGKREAAIRLAKGAARTGGEEVAKILAINDPELRASRLAEQVKDYSEGVKQQIFAANSAITVADVERQIEIETRKATWEHTKASRDQSAQSQWQQRVAKMDNEFSSVLGEWSDPEKGMPFLIDDAVKTRVVPEARKIFGGESDPKQLAKASLKAALFPEILRGWQQALQELERVNGSNDRYRSSYPGADTGGYNGYSDNGGRAPVGAINPTAVDGRFLDGLAAARARDMKG